MNNKILLVFFLFAMCGFSQGAFTAKADESANILAALSPYNVLVEAAYGGEKVKLVGLVIQRDIVPGYNKRTDSTKFYILISLSRIPNCFLRSYSYTVWQDKHENGVQLGAKSVSATLHRANAKANIGILRCDSLPYPVDGFPFLVSFIGGIDKQAYDSRKSFVLTPPTLIDNENKFSYAGKSANAKEFSIGSSVSLRGNTAYEIDKLSPLITGDSSFAAGVPLFYPDDRSPLKYSLAGLINFERYAPDVRLDKGQLYSATAYYYPVEYIRRAISHALPPFPKLDLPAHYKGMRASGAKVTTAATDNSLQIDDEITAIDGVPFDTKWGISASLYIALNYSGGNKIAVEYTRPRIKGKQAIKEAELQSSNSLWFGADAVPMPTKLKGEQYKNADNGFFVRSTSDGLTSIAVKDVIFFAMKDKDRVYFNERFQECCPRLDMWLWDNFGKGSSLRTDYFSFTNAKSMVVDNVPLSEWTNYPDTFSREPKSGVTPTTSAPPSTEFAAGIDAAQKCIELIRKTIEDCMPQDGKYAYGSELKETIEQARELIGKLEGYISDLKGTGRDKNHAVKSIIEASISAEVCVLLIKTAKINNDTINRSISVAQSAISRLRKVIEANTPRKPPPAESFFAKTLEEARKLIADLQTSRDTLNSPNTDKESRVAALNFIKDNTFEDLLLYYEKFLTEERANYEEKKPTTPAPPSTDFAAAITAAQNAIQDLNAAIAKVTDTPPAGSELGKALQAAKDLRAKLQGYLNTLNSFTATDEDKKKAQAEIITDISKVKGCIATLEAALAAYKPADTTTETFHYAEAIKAAEIAIRDLDVAIAKVTDTPPADSELGKALQAAKDLMANLQRNLNMLNSFTATDEEKIVARDSILMQVNRVKSCVKELEEARKKQRPVLASSTELSSLKNSANAAIAAARDAVQKAIGAADDPANTGLLSQADPYKTELYTDYNALNNAISAAKSAANNAMDKAKELEDLIKELTPDNYTETIKKQVNTALEQLRNYTAAATAAPGNISKARDALQSVLNRKLQSDLKGRAQHSIKDAKGAAGAAKNLAGDTQHLIDDAQDLDLEEVVYKPLQTAIEKANKAAEAAEAKAKELEDLINDSKTNLNNYQTRSNIEKLIAALYDDKAKTGLRKDAESAVESLTSCAEELIIKLVEALKAKADATVKSAKEAANKAKIIASATELSTLQQEAKQLDVNHKGLEDAISATKNAADQLDNRANDLLTLLNELGPDTYESNKEGIRNAITELQTAQDELDTKAITAAADALRSAVEEKKKQNAVADLKSKMAQAIEAVKTQNGKTDAALADADAIIEAARAMKLDTLTVFTELSNARNNADDAKQTSQKKAEDLEEQRDALTKDNFEEKKTGTEKLIAELTSKDYGLNSITAAATATLSGKASEMFAQLKQKANDIKNGAEKVRENASDAKEKLLVSLAELLADEKSAPLFGIDAAKADAYKNLLPIIEGRALKIVPIVLPYTDSTNQYELTAEFNKTVQPALDALLKISAAIEDSQLLLRDGWPDSLTEANATNATAIQNAFTAFESLPSLTETAKKASRIATGSFTMGMLVTGLVLLLLIGFSAFFIPYRIKSKRRAAAQAVTQADSRGFASDSVRHSVQTTKPPPPDKDQSEEEMKMRDYIVEIEKIKMQKEGLINEIALLERKRRDLDVGISEANKAASEQAEQLRKERDALAAELIAIKQQKSAVDDAKRSLKNLHTDLEKANTELLMKKAEIAELSANISKLNVENAKQNKENENLKADHEAVISAINKVALDRKIQIDDEVSEKEKHLHKLSKSIENYKKQAEDFEEVINQKKSKIEDLEVENENIVNTIRDNNNNKAIIEAEIDKLDEKRLDLAKVVESANAEIARLETQKSKLREKIRATKASFEEKGIIFVIPELDDEPKDPKPKPTPKKPEPKPDKTESTRKKAPSERLPLPHDPKPIPKKPGYTESAPVSNERTLDHIIRHDLTDFEARILNSIISLYSGNRTVSTGRLWVRLKHHDIMSHAHLDDEKAALASIGKLQVKFTNSVEEGISGVSLISNESEKEKERWVRFLRSFAERISRDKGLIKALDDRISKPPEPHGDETIVIDPNRKQTEPPVKIDLIGIDDDTGIQISIGRDKSCGFVIESEAASKDHATLSLVKGKMVLTDNKSTNGTYVNGIRISRTEVRLEDRVTFGDQTTTIGKIIESQDED